MEKPTLPRRLLIGFLASLLAIVIIVGVPLAATTPTLTNRDKLSNLVGDPAVFNTLKETIVTAQLPTDNKDPEQALKSATDQALLKSLVERYFTPDLWQRLTTEVPNGVFDWLDGKTVGIEFTVPISTDKEEFRNFITDAFMAKYKGLPVCGPGEVPSADLMSASCQVPLTDEQLHEGIVAKLQGPEFDQLFNQATVSSSNFADDLDPTATSNIRLGYKALKYAPLAVLLKVIILCGLIFLLSGKRWGFKKVGWALLWPSAIVLLGSVAWFLFDDRILSLALDKLNDSNAVYLKDVLDRLLRNLINDINWRRTIYSGVLTALAIGSLVAHHKLNPKAAGPSEELKVKPNPSK